MDQQSKRIYCTGCTHIVHARLTDGAEIYPHRSDLSTLPFWKCDECGNYVGCHHKTKHPTRPLGVIPTRELRNARKEIHDRIDPLWRDGLISRGALYAMISRRIGNQFHTAEIRSLDEARKVYEVCVSVLNEIVGRESREH